MRSRRYRVLLLSSHPVQYAVPVYRELARHPSLDILVAYCSLDGARPSFDAGFGVEVQWDVPLLDGYPWVHVPSAPSPAGAERNVWRRSRRLWQLLVSERFDAVVAYTGYRRTEFWTALLVARRTGARVLFGTDAVTLRAQDGRPWKSGAKALLWPALFRLADVVIVPSSGTARLVRRLGVPAERVVLTPFVVDNDWWSDATARADRAGFRRRWRLPDDVLVAAYSAKLAPWKRPQDLVEALAQTRSARIMAIYAGDGRMRPALEQQASTRGLADRVRFLGFVNQSGLPEVYASSDVLVLPSGYEAFGVVVNEAMLCGRPAIVTDQVGARFDLVQHGRTGFVYPVGDVQALASLLDLLDSDRALLARMGDAARLRMRSWSPRENAGALVLAVERALALRGGRTCAS